MVHFADKLIRRVRELGHPLCLGLDPHLPLIPPVFRRGTMTHKDPQTAIAVQEFLTTVIERVGDRVAVIKPQSAFFEQLGWRGIQVLEKVVEAAHRRGLLVILDAKRGDIDSTAQAYATYIDSQGPISVDAITVNPYLGRDTLAPFVEAAMKEARGLFVIVKTSNPGSRDYQDRSVEGEPLFEVVARSLSDLSTQLVGPDTAWSALGVVAGATYPEQSRRIRELLPRSIFLVPGYGAQGGTAREAVAGFIRGSSGLLEGGIVNSSRRALFPKDGMTEDVRAWESAFDSSCDRAIAELSAAIAG